MIVHDNVIQGSEAWDLLRLGIPTASCFGQVVCPPANKEKWRCHSQGCAISHTAENSAAMCKGGDGKPTKYMDRSVKRSESFTPYMLELLAERLSGAPLESFKSEWMNRGHEVEEEAKFAYAMLKGIELDVPGFVTNDSGTIGCSPDAMGLEVKCPSPRIHMKYLLDNRCPPTYYPQVQGCMYICERDAWDFMSYYPKLPSLIVTVRRDDNYISELDHGLQDLLKDLAEARQKLSGRL